MQIDIMPTLINANLKNPSYVLISNGKILFVISGDKIKEPASKHKIKHNKEYSKDPLCKKILSSTFLKETPSSPQLKGMPKKQ